jgi:hypothetical protein
MGKKSKDAIVEGVEAKQAEEGAEAETQARSLEREELTASAAE